MMYFHHDQLGSITVLTDSSATVIERDVYDAWGKRRSVNGADDPNDLLPISQTTRGYTGQEQVTDVALLNLNARMYDPQIGKFTSADPVTGQPLSTQGWNRYSYVGNNPLAFADPSGMCFLGCFWKSSVFLDIIFPIRLLTPLFKSVPILGDLFIVASGIVCGPFCAAASAAEITGFETEISGWP